MHKTQDKYCFLEHDACTKRQVSLYARIHLHWSCFILFQLSTIGLLAPQRTATFILHLPITQRFRPANRSLDKQENRIRAFTTRHLCTIFSTWQVSSMFIVPPVPFTICLFCMVRMGSSTLKSQLFVVFCALATCPHHWSNSIRWHHYRTLSYYSCISKWDKNA